MLEFKVVHKYCGYTKTVKGFNVWEAFKNNKLDLQVWEVVEVSCNERN